MFRLEAAEEGLVLHQCLVLSEVRGCWGGGASSLTLRHDGRCNALLALPCIVDFAAESHSSISVPRSEALG